MFWRSGAFILCLAMLLAVTFLWEGPAVLSPLKHPPAGARPASALRNDAVEPVENIEHPPTREKVTRSQPIRLLLSRLNDRDVKSHCLPVERTETAGHRNLRNAHIGSYRDVSGRERFYNPEILLVHFKAEPGTYALRVAPGDEFEALDVLNRRDDVAFAGLDHWRKRQFTPNDALWDRQWHHATLGSTNAWQTHLGSAAVQIALVDYPFQMDHPDLAANTVTGWDVLRQEPILSSPGIDHTTIGAGMAAAVINNEVGIAGISNCQLLPVNIVNDAEQNFALTSDMVKAVDWAIIQGIRLVNISWDGADDPFLNEAGGRLKAEIGGMLFMAGVNGVGSLDYPSHPHIYAISMTDEAHNARSLHGDHIDFAAPGWDIFSTLTNNRYGSGSGTSYAAPLVAGLAGVLMSYYPSITPAQIEAILATTAVDRGQPGHDTYYGWGEVDFAAAMESTLQLRQSKSFFIAEGSVTPTGFQIVFSPQPAAEYYLWKTDSMATPDWRLVIDPLRQTNGPLLMLTDPSPGSSSAFYRLEQL